MKPTDPEFEKMLGELFQAPQPLKEDLDVEFARAIRRFKRLVAWLTLILGLGYCGVVSITVLIVLGWLHLFGVI